MDLLPLDYVLGGAGIFLALLGLLRGFSGELGSACGWAAAAATAYFGWNGLQERLPERWQLAAAVLVATLVVFGLVRVTVAKLVHLALARPTDAFLGLLLGFAKVAAAVVLLVRFQVATDYSRILQQVELCLPPL